MDDLLKKKIVYIRSEQGTYTSIPVEFPVGISEVVSLIAIHWHIEQVVGGGGATGLLMAALSENPEHELTPPVGVAEFQGNANLYGMATWLSISGVNGSDWAFGLSGTTLIIPLYGILRPKRQVAVFANVWQTGFTGIRGEVYYVPVQPSRDVVDAISRRYGKYRRT